MNKQIDYCVIKILTEAKASRECEQYKLSVESRALEARYAQLEKEMQDIQYAIEKIKDINECNKDNCNFKDYGRCTNEEWLKIFHSQNQVL